MRLLARFVPALVIAATALVGSTVQTAAVADPVATQAEAQAGCYTWNRTLSSGSSGADVRELQVRVSGYAAYGTKLSLDGSYGPATATAVKAFQQAYGLGADGVAGPQTFAKLYALQDTDCTPIHFDYVELNRCNSSWAGGAVSAATAKENARVTMWRLEALRHALGDRPINLSSGFRSYSCNSAVGGAANSRHLYGDAADLVGSHSFCTLAKQARYNGFTGIYGPGYPGHDDHTHVDGSASRSWSAPTCGI